MKHFENGSRKAPFEDFWVQSISFSMRTSWNAENERSTSTDVSGASLYFRMFAALNTLESRIFKHSPLATHFLGRKNLPFPSKTN